MPTLLLSLLGSRQLWGALGLAALLGVAGVQTARLHHAKADLAAARAAQIDPATRQTWQAEAKASAADLAVCHAGLSRLDAALADQTAAVSALKTQGEADSAAANQALSQAQAQAKDATARTADILAAKPAAQGCASTDADTLILRSLNP